MKQLALELYQRKKPWVIAIGLLLLLNISALLGIVLFQLPALERKQALVTEQRKGLAGMPGGESGIYRNGLRDLEKLQTMIPTQRGFAPLLGELMNAAAECHLASDALTYKPENLRERKLLVYHLVLGVSGRYAAQRCFLHKLQSRKELVVIDGITMKNEDPYAENVSMELKLTMYLRDGA